MKNVNEIPFVQVRPLVECEMLVAVWGCVSLFFFISIEPTFVITLEALWTLLKSEKTIIHLE